MKSNYYKSTLNKLIKGSIFFSNLLPSEHLLSRRITFQLIKNDVVYFICTRGPIGSD